MTTLDENLSAGVREVKGLAPGRGVLEGAFILLDALAGYPHGAGLSSLARAADLPKATTHRLVVQLVELGAVERHGSCYVVGRLLGRLGASWRPNPELHYAAAEPVKMLAGRSSAAVVVSVLHEGRLKPVTAAPGAIGERVHALPTGSDLPTRSAAGQVLLAAESKRARERESARHRAETIPPDWADRLALDRQDVLPGVCCVATGVRSPDGRPVAAVSALTFGTTVPRGLGDLVRQTSSVITRNMRSLPDS